jgi:hypothetical protein
MDTVPEKSFQIPAAPDPKLNRSKKYSEKIIKF